MDFTSINPAWISLIAQTIALIAAVIGLAAAIYRWRNRQSDD